MCKHFAVLAAVIFSIACKVADQPEAAPADSGRMEKLKYSQFCTEASEKFWNRHDWKDQHEPSQITSYTSHYNKGLTRCLVDVHGISTLAGKVAESDHVYDALEDTVLGGRWIVKKAGAEDVLNVILIKDGRTIKDKQEAAAFVPWFQGLMTE
jgi:hypothetical protein